MGTAGIIIVIFVILLALGLVAWAWYLSKGGAVATATPAPGPGVGNAGGPSGTGGSKGTKDPNGHNAYGTYDSPVDPTSAAMFLTELTTLGLTNVTFGEGSFLTTTPRPGNLDPQDSPVLVTPPNPNFPNEVTIVNTAAYTQGLADAAAADLAAKRAAIADDASRAGAATTAAQSGAQEPAFAAWVATLPAAQQGPINNWWGALPESAAPGDWTTLNRAGADQRDAALKLPVGTTLAQQGALYLASPTGVADVASFAAGGTSLGSLHPTHAAPVRFGA